MAKGGPTKRIRRERSELLKWLEQRDEYEFLGTGEEELAREVVEAMDKILAQAAREICALGNKYRKVGIGDTATDARIAAEFYRLIH